MTRQISHLNSPLGVIEVHGGDAGISSVEFCDHELCTADCRHPIVQRCVQQLREYFSGERTTFDIPLNLQGTDFQLRVWRALQEVPFGATASYKKIAIASGNVNAVRAVGGANGKNPAPIIVPCHRIVGSDGSLTGFSSGMWRKEWLLKHEGSIPGDS